jgi:hypothetical protein
MVEQERQTPTPRPRDVELDALLQCTRCNLRYLPQKSTSSLKLTYCSFLCELGDLGFSMVGLEHMVRAPRPEAAPESGDPAEPVAID